MVNKNHIILRKIVGYIAKIKIYCQDANFDSFVSDERLQELCAFNLSQMGEFVNRMDDDFIALYPAIPWRNIRGLRNRITHDYEGIDFKVIWDVIENDLSDLQVKLEGILKSEDDGTIQDIRMLKR
jgi:uncharacterized protein with HEPN domain